MRKLALGVFLILVAGACASVKPMPIRTGELCFRCRRPILETRLAAQTIGGGLASNFRAPGCLAKYLADHPGDHSTMFVTDFASGRMIQAEAAVYVPTVDRDNGERDYIAFSDRTTAQSEATARSTSLVSWDAVLEQARQAQRGN
ncbi:MAG: hypothetical protein A3F69_05400 [Acidobacteria bacterium RIFCSPLOWO2_12_FULL_66_10]|nr:MAG: hypothetical protein A3F69_05400 [Acidobacteria bacterium RIFCSPLOWO2_12_FULL_66_10]